MARGRALPLLPLLLLAACMEMPPPRTAKKPPEYLRIQFVGRVPSPLRYELIGHVDGIAPDEDFIKAVHDARIDIKTKAARLGGDVVKIDDVRIPPTQRNGRRHVVLWGRVYRLVDDDSDAQGEPEPADARNAKRPARHF